MSEVLYGVNSFLIAGILFASMVVTIEVSSRIGRANHESTSEAAKTHVHAIQASLLGILALLLGFTFSLALQRFDTRSEAVVDEANAIGTAYLRAQLLPTTVQGEVRRLFQTYVDLRIQAGAISFAYEAERQVFVVRGNQVLDELWSCARRAAEEDPSPVTTGLFIQSLNEAIDSFGRRDASIRRHVPEIILFLLYMTFLMTSGVVGYSAGIAGHRPPFVTYIMVALTVLLAFIIIDLDRPVRGLITTDQTSFTDLKAAIDAAEAGVAQPAILADAPPVTVVGCG